MLDLDTEHPPWAFKLDGRVWTARRVSAQQVLAYCAAVATANKMPTARAQERGRLTATTQLLRLAFPVHVSYWWRRDDDPVRRILGLGPAAQEAVMSSFFASLGVTITPTPLATSTSPPGSAPASGSPAADSAPSGSSATT